MNTGTRTDRRILRTVEAINKGFLELLAEEEFERITINAISERANVNRGTVYLHYIDKYDLLDKVIEEHLNKMILPCLFTQSTQQKITGPITATESLKSFFVFIEENALFFTSMFSIQRSSVFQEYLLRIISVTIEKQIDMQGINQGMDQEMMTQFTASAFVATLKWWIMNQMPHSPQYMAEQIWELFKRNRIFEHTPG